jgi:DNA primase
MLKKMVAIPGMELAKRIKEDLNNATVIHLPENEDVNDVYLKHGPTWFQNKIA